MKQFPLWLLPLVLQTHGTHTGKQALHIHINKDKFYQDYDEAIFISMSIFLYLYMCTWCLWRSEEDVTDFVTGVEEACEPSCGY